MARMQGERSRGSASRKRSVALAVMVCLGLLLGLALVGQSAAEDPATVASDGEAIAPSGAVPDAVAANETLDSPDVEITVGPSGTVRSADATFAFSASSGDGFECSLDGGDYAPCSSPQTYSGLEDGTHLFSVRVSSAEGDSIPAQRIWTVQNLLACTGADEPANFPVYSAGASVDGLDVTSVTRRCTDPQPGAAGRTNFVSYLYGTCPELADGTADAVRPRSRCRPGRHASEASPITS